MGVSNGCFFCIQLVAVLTVVVRAAVTCISIVVQCCLSQQKSYSIFSVAAFFRLLKHQHKAWNKFLIKVEKVMPVEIKRFLALIILSPVRDQFISVCAKVHSPLHTRTDALFFKHIRLSRKLQAKNVQKITYRK